MGIVFAVLAILALSIKGISLLDRQPTSKATVAVAESAVPATVTVPATASDGNITGQQVAAIAVALALSEPKKYSIGPAISRGGSTAGSWLQSGRMRVLESGSSGARERRN
jgi:Na+-transporting methylmalonyl-CoA/oxaloacetate decarboxylase gamma subunit